MYEPSKLPELSPSVEREAWRQALLDAAELIRTKGLAREMFWDCRNGSFCTLGALSQVITGSWEGYREYAVESAEGKLREFLGGASIPSWNDEHTAADVISALEACARQG